MPRRAHVSNLHVGRLELGPAESNHLRNVLRLSPGDAVELFDDSGATAIARIESAGPAVVVIVDSISPPADGRRLTIASAVPKGDRADWLVEKLSELGVWRWTPLRTARSVVHPEGVSKFDRWRRIAVEAAKQSHRPGVLEISELLDLDSLIESASQSAIVLASEIEDESAVDFSTISTIVVGPEGGWDPGELERFGAAGVKCVRFPLPILRVETAAVVAAALALTSKGSP